MVRRLQFLLYYVKVEYPLKQGLKHGQAISIVPVNAMVKIEYPLKQGLNYSLKITTFI